MNRLLFMLFSIFLIASCENERGVESYWRLDFDEQVENPFFPRELSFLHDTLKIVDGNNFKQTSVFRKTNDSIYLTFEGGIISKYSFSTKPDSAIMFDNKKFFRVSYSDFSKTQPYELLGYKSGNKFRSKISSTIIHLVKVETSTKAILNDVKSELNDLPAFLIQENGKQPLISLYLGKGIEFKDLIEAYCWIKLSGFSKVELVTSNKSFEEFSSVTDYVNIDNTLFLDFLDRQQIPPPPSPKPDNDSEHIVEIDVKNRIDLESELMTKTTPYLINISDKLNITEYLELTEELNSWNKKNIKKKIKKFTTRSS